MLFNFYYDSLNQNGFQRKKKNFPTLWILRNCECTLCVWRHGHYVIFVSQKNNLLKIFLFIFCFVSVCSLSRKSLMDFFILLLLSPCHFFVISFLFYLLCRWLCFLLFIVLAFSPVFTWPQQVLSTSF